VISPYGSSNFVKTQVFLHLTLTFLCSFLSFIERKHRWSTHARLEW